MTVRMDSILRTDWLMARALTVGPLHAGGLFHVFSSPVGKYYRQFLPTRQVYFGLIIKD